jgi:hypothetical protein
MMVDFQDLPSSIKKNYILYGSIMMRSEKNPTNIHCKNEQSKIHRHSISLSLSLSHTHTQTQTHTQNLAKLFVRLQM